MRLNKLPALTKTLAALVAIGAVLKAHVCENYTDVDGGYPTEPRIPPGRRRGEWRPRRRERPRGRA